jgi:hypothetical protein
MLAMHPALLRHVSRPPRFAVRHVITGALSGLISVVICAAVIAPRLDPPDRDDDVRYAVAAARADGLAASNLAIARATIRRYAYHGFPSWAAAHPDLACPGHLSQLDVYVGESGAEDPWGADYRYGCVGAGMWVSSAGPDGEFDTDDDLRSD